MKIQASTVLLAALLGAFCLEARAADPNQNARFYIGGALGRSSMSLSTPDPWDKPKNNGGTGGKFYGGYRWNEYFGVEGGYARLGNIKYSTTAGGVSTDAQSGTGQAFYGAATGRYPIGPAWALNGRLGLARGKITHGDTSRPPDQGGSNSSTGLMAGFGGEYSVTQNIAVTADIDYFGKLSQHAKGGLLSVGVRASF